MKMNQITKREIPCQIILGLVVKLQESLFREFSYFSHGNWLGISLSVGGGD